MKNLSEKILINNILFKQIIVVIIFLSVNHFALSQNTPKIEKGNFKVLTIDDSFSDFYLIFVEKGQEKYTIHSPISISIKGQKIEVGKEYYFELHRAKDSTDEFDSASSFNPDVYFYGKYKRSQLGILCIANNLMGLTIYNSDSIREKNKELFEKIAIKYVKQFQNIKNECNVKPFYKINFVSTNDTIKFWLAGHIGKPSVLPPSKPGNTPPEDPKKLKGIIKINRLSFVIYDYKNSDGYGLFNPNSIDKNGLKKFENIDDECAAGVINPEAWLVAISNGKSLIIEKREPFKIQL